ncbi:MAG: hypothetical protein NTX25_19355 [Proteobacteria bacterium]|nr:hypothetical protein [Pseudomonadota bacterium]
MDTIDWDLVRQMRQGFLDAKDYLPDYWRNERWLEAYDQSLAQRIRWKWLAVLKALPQAFDWLESIPVVIDWGCGTGIASRSLLEVTGHRFSSLKLFDRSAFAMQFAKHKLAGEFPDQCVDLWPKQSHEDRPYLLLVSHVLSELPADQLARLTVLAQKAAAVLWLEPGRRLESRQLSQIHDELRSSFCFLA